MDRFGFDPPVVEDLPGGQFVGTYYDGNTVYGDRDGQLNWTLFSPGIGRVEGFDPSNPQGGVSTDYYHTDQLGTTRVMSDPNGDPIDMNGPAFAGDDAVYTAFGERIVNTFTDGASNRYGYVGVQGYQAHEEMPFLHVGHRYYDPSIGRFLQRDPIGILAGPNVYAYVLGAPSALIDQDGLSTNNPGGAARNTPAGAREVYETVSDMGSFGGDVKKIRYTKHAINQAISREGVGVASKAVLEAVKLGRWVLQRDGTARLVGKYATLIMREDGTIVTLWATCSAGQRIR